MSLKQTLFTPSCDVLVSLPSLGPQKYVGVNLRYHFMLPLFGIPQGQHIFHLLTQSSCPRLWTTPSLEWMTSP